MQENLREKGSFYEKKAGAFLEEKGYRILEYNYRCRRGEIDIIAQKEDTIVFCEVKYRKNDSVGHPLDAVTVSKQQRISKTAFFYLTSHRMLDASCRFDVIGITDEDIFHLENAFEYIGV